MQGDGTMQSRDCLTDGKALPIDMIISRIVSRGATDLTNTESKPSQLELLVLAALLYNTSQASRTDLYSGATLNSVAQESGARALCDESRRSDSVRRRRLTALTLATYLIETARDRRAERVSKPDDTMTYLLNVRAALSCR